VWDAQTGQPLSEPLKHSGNVRSAQFSLDGKCIVTASDGGVRVWDAQTGQPLTEPMKHSGRVHSAQFSPDGRWIVTASDDDARVWDAQTGQPLTEPFKHNGKLFSAQLSPDGKRIITAWDDGTARVWDIAPSAPNHPDWLTQLAEVVSGECLNNQGVLEQTKLNCGKVLNQLRQRLNQEPDDDEWVQWGRWFLADPATRTISPFSKITVPQYIENRIKENTAESLEEAEMLAFGNTELSERIAHARNTLEQTTHADLLK
jgi:WD40 repeat protein